MERITYKQLIGQEQDCKIKTYCESYDELQLPFNLTWSRDMPLEDVCKLFNNHFNYQMFYRLQFPIDYIYHLRKRKSNIFLGIYDKKELIGCIIKTSFTVCFHDTKQIENMANIELMCIHNQWRNKKLAPLLINEIFRITFSDKNLNHYSGITITNLNDVPDIFPVTLWIKKLSLSVLSTEETSSFVSLTVQNAKEVYDLYQSYAMKHWKVYLYFKDEQEFYNYFKSIESLNLSLVQLMNDKIVSFVSFLLQPNINLMYRNRNRYTHLHTFATLHNHDLLFDPLFHYLGNLGYTHFSSHNVMGIKFDDLDLLTTPHKYFAFNKKINVSNNEWGFSIHSGNGSD
jgi:hypothetical protein